MNRILIVDDEAVIRGALKRLLEREGYRTGEAGRLDQARAMCANERFDLVICDLRLPDGEGVELMPSCPETPVLIMTSYASVRSAVEAMRTGAVDYIAKPFDHDELLMIVARILRQRGLERENAHLRKDLAQIYPIEGMVGRSQAMAKICETLRKVAPTNTTVLIRGESGTGKELVARALHAKSPRADVPLVSVNCASIPETLLESELFGHEKGSFTGATASHRGLIEAADGGTLFLDEIGELTSAAQSRLLRVLQDGEIRRVGATASRTVDVRLVAATHRDLEQMVRDGTFREDLYYRLEVMQIHLPPLREREDDVPLLAEFLLDQACTRVKRPRLAFAPEAVEALKRHTWPGNVRELRNAIERAVILADDVITPDLLALHAPCDARGQPQRELSLDDYFHRFVVEHQGTLTETELARRLGISRKALWERRARMGIPRPKAEAR